MAKNYVSEHTQFMCDWLKKHPEQQVEKFKGRKLWWDKTPQSLDELRRLQDANVGQKGYVYDVN